MHGAVEDYSPQSALTLFASTAANPLRKQIAAHTGPYCLHNLKAGVTSVLWYIQCTVLGWLIEPIPPVYPSAVERAGPLCSRHARALVATDGTQYYGATKWGHAQFG